MIFTCLDCKRVIMLSESERKIYGYDNSHRPRNWQRKLPRFSKRALGGLSEVLNRLTEEILG